ncbi:MAG: hypothetical protein OK474_08260 [Thaumarchaeota archaeon]|nr:hypothetical protein [Nitrososphaerota archaeon]
MPDDDPSKIETPLQTVSRNRRTTLVTVYMEPMKLAPDVCDSPGFSDSILEVMGSQMESPVG